MKCYALVTEGQCKQVFCCDEKDIPLIEAGTELYEVEGLCDASDLYLSGGSLLRKPPRPPLSRWDSDLLAWVFDADLARQEILDRRRRLLASSDWTQLPDVPLATKAIWAIYRQALRDITDQPDPFNIVWPTPPQ
jgi:hypothetical protein